VGQAFDLLGHPISGECLQGLDNPSMQPPPPLQQEAAIGHLMGARACLKVYSCSENRRVSYRNSAACRCARLQPQGTLGQDTRPRLRRRCMT
jgi:hypothetical protein